MQFPESFDVIVVGGGHAGAEAALASARMGRRTLLLTHNIETLGQMSCNPSIGGIGKGHLVKEVDALGGAMAAATDEAGIQFRILNGSKGPAVRAHARASRPGAISQGDARSARRIRQIYGCFSKPWTMWYCTATRLSAFVTQMGLRFDARAVVLTAGTFLAGLVHVGLQNHQAGRAGDPPANALAHKLRELGLPVGRLKTGTPPASGWPHHRLLSDAGTAPAMTGTGILIPGFDSAASATTAVLDHAYQ